MNLADPIKYFLVQPLEPCRSQKARLSSSPGEKAHQLADFASHTHTFSLSLSHTHTRSLSHTPTRNARCACRDAINLRIQRDRGRQSGHTHTFVTMENNQCDRGTQFMSFQPFVRAPQSSPLSNQGACYCNSLL